MLEAVEARPLLGAADYN
jgi:hypothetical protein